MSDLNKGRSVCLLFLFIILIAGYVPYCLHYVDYLRFSQHVKVNENGIKPVKKEKPKRKSIFFKKKPICKKHQLFERFHYLYWPYYVENECGPLKNEKCCHTMKNDTGGYTCYGVAINHNNEFYKAVEQFIKKKEKGVFDIEPYAKLQIYSKYFKGSKISGLHPKAVQAVFDYAIHSGPSTAIKALQRNVGVKADGKIGPKTIEASAVINLDKYGSDRAKFIRGLKIYKSHPQGMEARIKKFKKQALKAYSVYLKHCGG